MSEYEFRYKFQTEANMSQEEVEQLAEELKEEAQTHLDKDHDESYDMLGVTQLPVVNSTTAATKQLFDQETREG